ncbi:hypothetical protein KL86SPO_20584 [uncultured Sporomusa sp.]|uniref:Uncharacterized protein n=1 Tax=uncultured Sporomusa sp. TaxID=307249 RepID=A0A212LPU7_9FIRM|nr:hypothetical protein KL86SPO_20584 [uncultured Sporomusa sp.]
MAKVEADGDKKYFVESMLNQEIPHNSPNIYIIRPNTNREEVPYAANVHITAIP